MAGCLLLDWEGKGASPFCAYTIKRISFYGINVSLPFIIMRHWDEYTKTGQLKIDEKDKALCELILDIQLYSQRIYFGKYTEHYFEERKTDISEKAPQNMHTKTVRLLGKLPVKFNYSEMCKSLAIDRGYARVLTCRWMSEGLIECIDNNKKTKTFKKTKKGNNV